ncbi:MAG: diguanylate cyclase [Pseudonocardia sp.]|nr:diguanylate cyclase [Pseudonocardia sp.]
MRQSPRRRCGITRWAVWTQSTRVIAALTIVESCAAGLVVTTAIAFDPSASAVLLGLLLAVTGIAHTEIATGVERARRRVGEKSYTDLSTIWTFAAAVLLPPAVATAAVVVIYTHLWFRVWKPARFPLYRHVFTTSTVLLAVRAAHEIVLRAAAPGMSLAGLAGLAVLLLAAAAYATVNSALIAAAVAANDPQARPTDLFGHLDDIMVEVATLCLGAMLALTLTISWWFVLLAFPPILVLQRAVLVRELAAAASTDGKTGLLTAAAWNVRAGQELRRARRGSTPFALLVLDLDHFKNVNDTHGHLAGDRVLAAVAGAVRDEVRGNDLVGRFGGEEFVVLLPGLPGDHPVGGLRMVAERIRIRVEHLDVPIETPDGPLSIANLSISAGGAIVTPEASTTIEQVLSLADRALYAAKGAGRNAVRIAGHPVAGPRIDSPALEPERSAEDR